ncbi:Formaldehyde-activating enzyme [Cedecea neteri]|uniref:Formaldehyde-activating enzyme n=1 Tax=Cedecea neteri TaxID=158822 RepID=A0A2X2VDH4_9ENTR|nr:Formaldehyde-activating enzyme [Cedecea neteri]
MEMYIGEGFEGNGVNASHINIMIGPRSGVVGQAFSSSLASPSQGHCPFMVVIKPNVPAKPMTLYVNKAEISGELHGNATWGASQAAIAKAVTEALLDGTLPAEAEDEWCIVTANWVNPAVTTSTRFTTTTTAPAVRPFAQRWANCRSAARLLTPCRSSAILSTPQKPEEAKWNTSTWATAA